MSDFVLDRNLYRPSGRVNWPRFLSLAALTLAAACGLAAILAPLARQFTNVPPVLYPVLAHLGVLGFMILAIGRGECRSRLVAVLLGIFTALIIAVGPAYIDLMNTIGWRHAHRFDLLPGFIVNHRVVDPDTGAHKFAPGVAQGREPDFGLFAVEGALALFVLPYIAARRASRVYCEKCRRWSEHTISFFPLGSSAALAEAVESGDWARTAGLRPTASVGNKDRRYTAAALEWCEPPNDASATTCPVYFTTREISYGGGLGIRAQYDHAFGRVIVPPTELDVGELFEMCHLFPVLKSMAAAAARPAQTVAAARPSTAFTDVRPIPAEAAGRILSKGAIAIGNIMAVLPLVGMLGFLGLGGLFAWWATLGGSRGPGHLQIPTAVFVSLAVFSAILGVAIGVVSLRNVSAVPNRWLRRRAINVIEFRPDSIVRPHDPNALFVEIVPRAHWGKLMIETATDIGFMTMDSRRRELRFEGDRERYRIPAGAILAVDVENTGGEIAFYMVVLQLAGPTGPWELSLTPRAVGIFVPNNHRMLAADHLSSEIAALANLPAPTPV